LIALGAAITVAGGDAPAGGDGALPLAAAVEAAVETGDVETGLSVMEDSAAAGSWTLVKESSAGIDLYHRTPNEHRIVSTLKFQLVQPLDFQDVPLSELAAALSEQYKIQIVFDTAAMDAVAVSPDTEVSVSLRDIPLRSALRLTLMQIPDLTYVVKDDVLLITTREEANAALETHIYDLSNLAKDVSAVFPRL
jgi:hypothetical protein